MLIKGVTLFVAPCRTSRGVWVRKSDHYIISSDISKSGPPRPGHEANHNSDGMRLIMLTFPLKRS